MEEREKMIIVVEIENYLSIFLSFVRNEISEAKPNQSGNLCTEPTTNTQIHNGNIMGFRIHGFDFSTVRMQRQTNKTVQIKSAVFVRT